MALRIETLDAHIVLLLNLMGGELRLQLVRDRRVVEKSPRLGGVAHDTIVLRAAGLGGIVESRSLFVVLTLLEILAEFVLLEQSGVGVEQSLDLAHVSLCRSLLEEHRVGVEVAAQVNFVALIRRGLLLLPVDRVFVLGVRKLFGAVPLG